MDQYKHNIHCHVKFNQTNHNSSFRELNYLIIIINMN